MPTMNLTCRSPEVVPLDFSWLSCIVEGGQMFDYELHALAGIPFDFAYTFDRGVEAVVWGASSSHVVLAVSKEGDVVCAWPFESTD